MNSTERVWAALNHEPVDRIPIHAVAVDGNICDEVLGKSPRSAFEIIDELEQQHPDDWVERVNTIINEIEINVFSRAMETASIIGYDTCGAGYIPFQFESKEEMTDIFGRKYKIINHDGNIFPDYYGGLIKNQTDWETFPKPDLNEIFRRAKKFFRTLLRRKKKFANPDFLIMAQDDFASVFPPVWQGMGMEAFARALRKNPKMIKERFEQTTEFVLAIFKVYSECGAKVFFEGGDIAFKGGPLINPKYIDRYVLPHMQQVIEAVHEWGGKIIFHSDGDITSLLDFVVEAGFDALHCLEPPYVDLDLVKKKVGDKLCLLGNIDTAHVLVKGTKDEVEKAVKFAIKKLGPGGGYILSPSNSHPLMKYQQIKWMIEATKKFGVYPLNFS
ncbi:MAG: uroporphyrinogen decarboxylase family protein [Promethearchaeota archaeon]